MAMKAPCMDQREHFIERLNTEAQFPAHGRTTAEGGGTFLVFPFIRALWERAPPGETLPSTRAPLKFRDYHRMGYFQRHFWKVATILSRIAADEAVIIKGVRDQSPPEEYLPYYHAHDTLPIWLDLFYVYFRILADRFCVALGYLASEQPGGWPRNFRDLINADLNQLERWKVRDAQGLFNALQSNRGWFDALTTAGHEGVRDAIVHTLAYPTVVTRMEDGRSSVIVWRETPTGYEERDLVALVPEVVTGFCSMLSSLPTSLWQKERFEGRDLVESDGAWPAVDRFFPVISMGETQRKSR